MLPMSRDREAGATPSRPSWPELPVKPLLPLTLLAAAVAAALLASQGVMAAWVGALALLLATAGAAVAGAYWSRQRQQERLRDARQHQQLLTQLVGCWQWQTDAEHRLIRFQPPQGAPASAWVDGSACGLLLWQRFDDAAGSLRARVEARVGIEALRVQEPATPPGPPRGWRLSALPRLDSRGRFAGYLGVAEPTAATDQAAARDAVLDALLADGPVGLCRLDPAPDGWQLTHASPAARLLLGLEGRDALPLPWASLVPRLPESLRAALTLPQAGASAQADGWQGRWLPLGPAVPGAPTTQDSTPPPPLLLALAPTELAVDSATQALAAEHAAFSYTISHDLRAPIRVVEGFGRILKEDYGTQLDRIGRDHLDRMVSAAARMNHMIDALLSLSQLSTQPLKRQPVNLSQLAGYVVEELRRAQPERQASVYIAPQLGTTGDPTLLRMALENLLGNAWKYSARTAMAEIRFERIDQGGRPVYLVSDNGAGFDMRFADRLFGVFQRLHSASDFQGTGVGLASVRRIVRRHGGEIWAESEVGQGARFYFTLKG